MTDDQIKNLTLVHHYLDARGQVEYARMVKAVKKELIASREMLEAAKAASRFMNMMNPPYCPPGFVQARQRLDSALAAWRDGVKGETR